MNMKHIVPALALLVLHTCTLFAQHPEDYRWDDKFGLDGITFTDANSDKIATLQATSDYIITGGRFLLPYVNLAFWEKATNQWKDFAYLSNAQYTAGEAIEGVFVNDDTVYVWGNFSYIGNIQAKNFAYIDMKTKRWYTDTNFVGKIFEIRKLRNSIIVKGNFTIKNKGIKDLANFHSGAWEDVSFNTTIMPSLIPREYKGELYMINPNGSLNYGISVYRNDKWIPLFDSILFTNVFTPVSIGNMIATSEYLCIYGAMKRYKIRDSIGKNSNGILLFDGKSWENIVEKITYNGSNEIKHVYIDGDEIYVTGQFTSINNIDVSGIAKYSLQTKRWSALGSGIAKREYSDEFISRILIENNRVYVVGRFENIGTTFLNNIGYYNKSSQSWEDFRTQYNKGLKINFAGTVSVFAEGNLLIAVGDVNFAGNTRINKMGKWNGKSWQSLGKGIISNEYNPYDGRIRALLVRKGLSQYARYGSKLILGGLFETLDNVKCDAIMEYEDNNLTCMGGGLKNSYVQSQIFFAPSYVTDVIVDKSNVYVTGNFQQADTIQVNAIAMWDSKSWKAMGNGITKVASNGGVINKLALDSNKHLIVVGNFREVDSIPCPRIARWDGKKWYPVISYSIQNSSFIRAVCVSSEGKIIVGGIMPDENDRVKNGIAIVEDSVFKFIDTLSNSTNYIRHIGFRKNILYVVGVFDSLANIQCNNVASYDFNTKKWSSLGTGIPNSLINTIAFVDDTVYFGGEFNFAGNKHSSNIACWRPVLYSSVESNTEYKKSEIYEIIPNPADNIMKIRYDNTNIHSIVISDYLGKTIEKFYPLSKNEVIEETQISTEHFSSGLYYLTFLKANNSISLPFSVIH